MKTSRCSEVIARSDSDAVKKIKEDLTHIQLYSLYFEVLVGKCATTATGSGTG